MNHKRFFYAFSLAFLFACGGGVDPICGDGLLDAGEECDDGNNANGDGCAPDCQSEVSAQCGDGVLDPGEICEEDEALAIDAYVESLGELNVPAPLSTTPIDDPLDTSYGPYSCTTQTFQEIKLFDTFLSQGAVANRIYPGALLDGSSLASGFFDEVPLPKKPLEIAINIPQLPVTSTLMENPSLGDFIAAQNELIVQGLGQLPLDQQSISPQFFDFDFASTFNEDELSLQLAFDVSAGVATQVDVAGQFDFLNQEQQSRTLVFAVTHLYTISLSSLPTSASDFLADSVSLEEVQSLFADGNPSVFVDSVTFGRVVYLAVESRFSAQEIAAALQAAVDSVQADATLDFGLTARQVLQETTVKGVVVAPAEDDTGDDVSDVALLPTAGGPEALQRINARDVNTTPQFLGQPVAFTLRYLRDTGKTTQSFVDATFPRETCERAPIDFAVDVNQMRINGVSDDSAGNGENTAEVRGQVAISFGNSRVVLFSRGAGDEVVFTEGAVVAGDANAGGSPIFLSDTLQGVDTTFGAGNEVTVEVNLVEDDGGFLGAPNGQADADDDTFNQDFTIPVEDLYNGEVQISVPSGAGMSFDLFLSFVPSAPLVP